MATRMMSACALALVMGRCSLAVPAPRSAMAPSVAVASVVAVGIVPEGRRASAVALVWAAFAAANILGVPPGGIAGTGLRLARDPLGDHRARDSGLSAMAGAVPDAGKADNPLIACDVRALGRPQVLLTLTLAALILTSRHGVFTFIAPLLREITGVASSAIPSHLLAFGVGGVIGVRHDRISGQPHACARPVSGLLEVEAQRMVCPQGRDRQVGGRESIDHADLRPWRARRRSAAFSQSNSLYNRAS
jgi:hypothetical protein